MKNFGNHDARTFPITLMLRQMQEDMEQLATMGLKSASDYLKEADDGKFEYEVKQQ